MKILFFFILCALSFSGWTQDERLYRSILTNEINDDASLRKEYKVEVKSSAYTIDIDQDGINEQIQTMKKDGLDFIRINNAIGQKLYEGKIVGKGKNSSIFKIDLKTISKNVKTLILHFYEGDNQGQHFEGSGRLYLLTILENDLKKIFLSKGPYFWTEKEKGHGKYWNRRYNINTLDYNGDGVKEISVTFNKIQRILTYMNNGQWKTL